MGVEDEKDDIKIDDRIQNNENSILNKGISLKSIEKSINVEKVRSKIEHLEHHNNERSEIVV